MYGKLLFWTIVCLLPYASGNCMKIVIWFIMATMVIFCILFLPGFSQYSLCISTRITSISFYFKYPMLCWSPNIWHQAYIISSKVSQPHLSSLTLSERSVLVCINQKTMTYTKRIRKLMKENWNSSWFVRQVYCSSYRHRYWALLQELICMYLFVFKKAVMIQK